MKHLFGSLALTLGACVLSSVVFAAAPSNVANSLLYQVNDRLGPVAPTTTSLTLLRADGTFQDVWTRDFLGYGEEIPTTPANGSYTYVVSGTDPAQSVLTLNSTALTLRFQDDETGIVNGADGWTFHLYPAATSGGATNVSNRVWISPEKIAVTGFVVGGTSGRWVLIRAAGPALADLGVPVVVPAPQLRLFGATGGELLSIGSWSANEHLVPGMKAVFDFAGAFPFADTSADCAALIRLDPGAYTMHASGATVDAEVLMEAYVLPIEG